MRPTPLDHIDRILAEWRRERPELDTTAMGLIGRLLRAAQLADAALADRLRQDGLQEGWFDILAALRRAGAPYERNPSALMDTVMVSSGGMTKRLDRLAEAGLIERRPDADDRRGTVVRLTRKGRVVIDAAVETHLAREAALLRPLSAPERKSLDLILRRWLAALET